MDSAIEAKIKEQINNKVTLYMKGTPDFPACGFSAKAISLLKQSGLQKSDIHTVNVLEDDEIREGIKQFSQWPTIPQLYIKGEFVGGSDIMADLHSSGELKKMLS